MKRSVGTGIGVEVSVGDAARRGVDASPAEEDVAGTGNSIFSKLENIDAARSGMDASLGEGDASPGEGDVAGTGNSIFSKLENIDATQNGVDALLGEGNIAGTKNQEVKPERSSAERAPTEGGDDPWPERPTKEDEDERPPW